MNSRSGESSAKRGRGRPPTYVFSGDEELSESMEKLKLAIEKRRKSQKAKYHRKKLEKKNNQAKTRPSNSGQRNQREQSVIDGGLILDMAIAGVAHAPKHHGYRPVYPRF